jgi:hypothetical protein
MNLSVSSLIKYFNVKRLIKKIPTNQHLRFSFLPFKYS